MKIVIAIIVLIIVMCVIIYVIAHLLGFLLAIEENNDKCIDCVYFNKERDWCEHWDEPRYGDMSSCECIKKRKP